MGKTVILLCASAPLLLGQMCGTAGPVQQDFGSGLEPGLYTGTSQTTILLTATDTDPVQSTDTNDASTLTVASSGVPTDTQGRDIAVGLTDSVTAGGMVIELSVRALTVDDGKVSANLDASMTITFPDNSTVTLTGSGTDVYVQNGSTLNNSTHLVLSGNYGNKIIMMDLRSTATVSQ